VLEFLVVCKRIQDSVGVVCVWIGHGTYEKVIVAVLACHGVWDVGCV
jgi:hypothetical protein